MTVQSDNRTVVSYVQKAGGTRSLVLLNLTYELLETLDKWNISISAEYIPGKYNDIADRLSRGKPPSEWHLLQPAATKIFNQFGTPQIDLFASKETKVVDNYVTRDSLDRSAQYCNAFSRQWRFRLAWIFPPPSLIPRILHHLNSAEGVFLLVAPMWQRAYWLPDLRRRAFSKPVKIQQLDKVLIDQTTGLPPPRVQVMVLYVWRIGAGTMSPVIGFTPKNSYLGQAEENQP